MSVTNSYVRSLLRCYKHAKSCVILVFSLSFLLENYKLLLIESFKYNYNAIEYNELNLKIYQYKYVFICFFVSSCNLL